MTDFNTKEFDTTKYEAFKRGTVTKKLFGTIEKNTDVKNDDKLIIMHDVSIDSVIHSVLLTNTAMAGFTGVKLVALKPNSKDIIKNGEDDLIIADNISFAEAKSNVDIFPQDSKNISLKHLLNVSSGKYSSVDLALVSSTVGTAEGKIYVKAEFSSPF